MVRLQPILRVCRRRLKVEIQPTADDLISELCRGIGGYKNRGQCRIEGTFQVQRGSHAMPSTPAPTVHPVFTPALENAVDDAVTAANVSVLLPEIDTRPYARPPVA